MAPTVKQLTRILPDALAQINEQNRRRMADGDLLVVEGLVVDLQRVPVAMAIGTSEREVHVAYVDSVRIEWCAYTIHPDTSDVELHANIEAAKDSGCLPVILVGSDGSQVHGLQSRPASSKIN